MRLPSIVTTSLVVLCCATIHSLTHFMCVFLCILCHLQQSTHTHTHTQAMPHEMEEVIVPGEGMMEQKDLHDEDGLKPRNHYTLDEKIDMALIMAESLADLHGFPDGVM